MNFYTEKLWEGYVTEKGKIPLGLIVVNQPKRLLDGSYRSYTEEEKKQIVNQVFEDNRK